MANTIQTTTLLNGDRNMVVLVNLKSDGSTGDETNKVLIDRSALGADGTETVVTKIEGSVTGFSATLSFDATADLGFVHLPDGQWFCHEWECIGGVSSNKAGAGATGDILLSTSGFSVASDLGTFIIHMKKS